MKTARQLVGRQVLRNFIRHGIHKGTITSFDDDGELTFRVEYEDGDAEDLVEADVRETLIDTGIVRVTSRSRREKEARWRCAELATHGVHCEPQVFWQWPVFESLETPALVSRSPGLYESTPGCVQRGPETNRPRHRPRSHASCSRQRAQGSLGARRGSVSCRTGPVVRAGRSVRAGRFIRIGIFRADCVVRDGRCVRAGRFFCRRISRIIHRG